MKKKKNIFLVIGITIIILVGSISYLVISDLKQEDLLKQEIINLSNKDLLSDDYTINVKTSGDYGYIEEAIKKYYRELSGNIKTLSTTLDNDELINILSVENIQNDRPNFKSSYQLLENTKLKTNEALNNIANLCKEETLKGLIDQEKVDDYYVDLYKELMYTKEDLKKFQEVKTEMENLNTNLNLFLDKIREILNMLERTNNSWIIENDQLYFEKDSEVEEYNHLYEELTTIANEKLSTQNSPRKSSHSDNSI